MIKYLDLKKQYEGIKEEIDHVINSVIQDCAFVGGKYLETFERDFSKYHDVPHCIGVGNGTDALEIAIQALDLPKDSEILVPAYTFIATSEAVTLSGHRVVFCDASPDNYTISIEDIKKKVSSKTKAIIVVHLYGHPCDMDSILDLAKEHDLKVIEDCAQAHAAEYKGRRVGTLGDLGTFSFYPGKNLGAYGDAGAIITKNKDLESRCRLFSNHGRNATYLHKCEGRNSRLDGLQAAVLSVKLKHLDAWTERRRQVASYYIDHLKDKTSLILPEESPWAKHVYHLFVIRCKNRDSLNTYLNKHDVATGIHYPKALPRLHAYIHLEDQYKEPMFVDTLSNEVISLPMGEHLEDIECEKIVELLKSFEG